MGGVEGEGMIKGNCHCERNGVERGNLDLGVIVDCFVGEGLLAMTG